MVWSSSEFRERASDFLAKRRMSRRRFMGTYP
jgi:hypothetical protein